MGGSRASSVGNSNGRKQPKCFCDKFMKMWVSNTDENPKRKFWRCRNFWEDDVSCDLFIWDDELDDPRGRQIKKVGSKIYEISGCNSCGMIMDYLRDFGKEYGKKVISKKHLRTKKKLHNERNKNFGLMVALSLSWIFFFSVVYKFM